MAAVYVIAYASVLVFVLAVVIRGYRALSMPLHLRWEIYPVAHEKGRAHYGGSYFEELDWWTKPRASSKVSELTAMGAEILLLKGVWEHNRRLWWRSYPFHLGLYLLIGFLGLTILGAILAAIGAPVASDASALGAGLDALIGLSGWAGLILATLGTVLLLIWRLTDEDVRDYTRPSHIANLVIILIGIGTALIACLAEDPGFVAMRGFVYQLVTFQAGPIAGTLVKLAVVASCLMIAYIPLTHMAHFFLKYCTWHQIRWNDTPNLPGGPMEAQIMAELQKPITWSAPHIGADGKKTWADVATSPMPEQEKGKKT